MTVVVSRAHAPEYMRNVAYVARASPRPYPQADQNRVNWPPTADRYYGTPDSSNSQYTAEKNHWLTPGANNSSSRIRKPHCLAGATAR
jgi:hypothetical protein